MYRPPDTPDTPDTPETTGNSYFKKNKTLKNTQRDWDRHNKTEYKREEEEDMKQINIHMTAYINSEDKYKTASSVYWKEN